MLEVRDLTITFPTPNGTITPIRNVSFNVARGETVGIVGRSGSGKSVLCSALIGMIEYPGYVEKGSIAFAGRDAIGHDLLSLSERQWRKIRGREISMIFQDSVASLNPSRTIQSQMTEAILLHSNKSRSECVELSTRMLQRMLFDQPNRVLQSYPFELSGGMCQRVMIAVSLMHNPTLLIADEPTTALDTVSQAQILQLLKMVSQDYGTSIILISHDAKNISTLTERVIEIEPMSESCSDGSHFFSAAG